MQALYQQQQHLEEHQQEQQQPMPDSYANYGTSMSIDTNSNIATMINGHYYYPGKTTFMSDGSIVYHQPLQPIDMNVVQTNGNSEYIPFNNPLASADSQYTYEDGMKIMSTVSAENELKNATDSITPVVNYPLAIEDWTQSVICYGNDNDRTQHQLKESMNHLSLAEEQVSYSYNVAKNQEDEMLDVVEVSNDAIDKESNQPGYNIIGNISMSKETMQLINSRYTHQRFPIKLWNLASDENFIPIGWSSDGLSVVINEVLLEPVLGSFFRSKKYSSFLRQLHLYGFRKVTRARLHRPIGYHNNNQLLIGGTISGSSSDTDRYEYIAEYQCNDFQRDRFDLVKNVRRFYQC